MLKYVDTKVVFAEVPNEVTLAINLSNCPFECKGCHSPYLREDIGSELTKRTLERLIQENYGITCVCFMGGDHDHHLVEIMAYHVKQLGLKSAWYSGKQRELCDLNNILAFDYIKLGPYIEEFGPLSSVNTNQRFYKVMGLNSIEDITYMFQ